MITTIIGKFFNTLLSQAYSNKCAGKYRQAKTFGNVAIYLTLVNIIYTLMADILIVSLTLGLYCGECHCSFSIIAREGNLEVSEGVQCTCRQYCDTQSTRRNSGVGVGGAHTNYVFNSENTSHFFQVHFRIQDAEVLAPNSK